MQAAEQQPKADRSSRSGSRRQQPSQQVQQEQSKLGTITCMILSPRYLAQSPEYPESKNTSNKSPEHREFKNTTLAIAWVPAVSRPNSAHKFENDALLEAQWPRQMQRRALWLYRLLVLDKLQAHHEAKVLRVADGLRSDALK